MGVYQTIWTFIMTYIFGNPDSYIWEDGFFWVDLLTFMEGTDGRLVFSGFNFYSVTTSGTLSIFAHFITLCACVSLCIMLWKLLTLPIKWALNAVK